ncbi:hypothetical protein ACJJTC_018936 [Scirpophaga incertulas]
MFVSLLDHVRYPNVDTFVDRFWIGRFHRVETGTAPVLVWSCSREWVRMAVRVGCGYRRSLQVDGASMVCGIIPYYSKERIGSTTFIGEPYTVSFSPTINKTHPHTTLEAPSTCNDRRLPQPTRTAIHTHSREQFPTRRWRCSSLNSVETSSPETIDKRVDVRVTYMAHNDTNMCDTNPQTPDKDCVTFGYISRKNCSLVHGYLKTPFE